MCDDKEVLSQLKDAEIPIIYDGYIIHRVAFK
jgi:hypothetical protein